MRRAAFSGLFLASVLLVASCNRPPELAPPPEPKHQVDYVSDANSVGFDIEPLATEGDSSAWLVTYSAGGKLARFKIEFGPVPPEVTGQENEVMAGHGRLIAEPDSDATVFLPDLAKALEAKRFPKRTRHVNSLAFEYVSLGEAESQAQDGNGGFFDDPHGDWVIRKIFIGEDSCEFFINLNPVIKKGQISMKDADYGNCAIAELAKVL
jgi:hypothetical protein